MQIWFWSSLEVITTTENQVSTFFLQTSLKKVAAASKNILNLLVLPAEEPIILIQIEIKVSTNLC